MTFLRGRWDSVSIMLKWCNLKTSPLFWNFSSKKDSSFVLYIWKWEWALVYSTYGKLFEGKIQFGRHYSNLAWRTSVCSYPSSFLPAPLFSFLIHVTHPGRDQNISTYRSSIYPHIAKPGLRGGQVDHWRLVLFWSTWPTKEVVITIFAHVLCPTVHPCPVLFKIYAGQAPVMSEWIMEDSSLFFPFWMSSGIFLSTTLDEEAKRSLGQKWKMVETVYKRISWKNCGGRLAWTAREKEKRQKKGFCGCLTKEDERGKRDISFSFQETSAIWSKTVVRKVLRGGSVLGYFCLFTVQLKYKLITRLTIITMIWQCKSNFILTYACSIM